MKQKGFTVEGDRITLSAMYKEGEDTVIRLFNGADSATDSAISFGDSRVEMTFTPYEIKTFRYTNGCFVEQDAIL